MVYSRIGSCSVIYLSLIWKQVQLDLVCCRKLKASCMRESCAIIRNGAQLCCPASIPENEGKDTAFEVRINHACYYLCLAESGHCSVYSLLF